MTCLNCGESLASDNNTPFCDDSCEEAYHLDRYNIIEDFDRYDEEETL